MGLYCLHTVFARDLSGLFMGLFNWFCGFADFTYNWAEYHCILVFFLFVFALGFSFF